MVKDHTDSERGNPLPPHRLLFPISSKGPTDRITHTRPLLHQSWSTGWKREIAQWVHHERSIRRPRCSSVAVVHEAHAFPFYANSTPHPHPPKNTKNKTKQQNKNTTKTPQKTPQQQQKNPAVDEYHFLHTLLLRLDYVFYIKLQLVFQFF